MLAQGFIAIKRRLLASYGAPENHPAPSNAWLSAVNGFFRSWLTFGGRLYASFVRFCLHGVACGLLLGAVAGMYVRGLTVEYRATWESTFLDASQVRGILLVVLGPASALLGDPIPSAGELDELRRTGGPAAPWIHRYALTAVLFVFLPRALLMGRELWQIRRLSHHLPLPIDTDPYFVRTTALIRGQGQQVYVQPFGYTPPMPGLATLKEALHLCFGRRTEVRIASRLLYLDAEQLAADASARRALLQLESPAHRYLLLFNLAQTPEEEVHGSLIEWFIEAAGERVAALVDESVFSGRLAAPVADKRLEERRAAWRRLLSAHPLPTVAMESRDGAETLAEKLRAAFHASGAEKSLR
jgi:hypothetical protein